MYKKKVHVHFVGIGGIGMSGIATILKHQGYDVSGCDSDLEQQSVHLLQKLGCHVYQGNNTKSCNDSDIDILVYSSAIKSDNPEIIAAQQRGIPTIPRALMLAELMRTKYSIAIAGAHGKTTTTSLISHILIEAGLDPTVIIGGHLRNISTNARFGNGDFLVAEADESDRSLLHLQATIAILTTVDLEHLETYTDLDDIKQTFKQFLNNLPFYGLAIVCIDDENIQSMLPMPHIKTIKYGLSNQADLCAKDVQLNSDHSTFSVWQKNKTQPFGSIFFKMPGEHNVRNALAAITLAQELGVPFKTIAKALYNFKGIERRFCFKGYFKEAEIFDDYGHHPREIENTLTVAQKRAKNKIVVVFQPHRYSRTSKLWNQFIDTFLQSKIHHLIVTDIYAANETMIPEITSQRFVQELKEHNPSFTVSYTPYESTFDSLSKSITDLVQPDDLILLLGAGKLNRIIPILV